MGRALSAELGKLSRHAADLAVAGRHHEAVAAWERVRRCAPDNADVAAGLGAALLDAGRNEAARDWLVSACQRYPRHVLLLRLQAQALMRLHQRRPAIGALFTAIDLEPEAVAVNADLARALYLDAAAAVGLPYAVFAFNAEPTFETAATLTSILLDLGYREEPLKVIARAFRAGVDRASMFMLQSLVLQFLDRDEEGVAAAREAVACAPDDSRIRFNLAAALLLEGDYTAEAWALYESRAGFLNMKHWPQVRSCWTGGDIAGRTILLVAEQGLGDTLQFVRYVPLVAARGARVVLVVQAPLVSLLQGTRGADMVVASGQPLPAFDLYCPLLSLPGVFGTTLATVPPVVPYAMRFAPAPGRPCLQVGLVWAGNPAFIEDRRRSIIPALLAPLQDVPGVEFHNLQLGAETLPLPGMHDLIRGTGDFAETARRVASLDLVIAVDTSVAHLAATMGKPVWLLARHQGCWRWLREQADTPWYPSMRIYRQRQSNDWAAVIREVCGELEVMAGSGREATILAA